MQKISTEPALRAFLAAPQTAWFFKHSNACGISSQAFSAFSAHCADYPEQSAAYLIIQEQRPLSQLCAELLGRVHQSPQVFLVRDGQVLWTATHLAISQDALRAAWQEHAG